MTSYDVLRRSITLSDCWGYSLNSACATEPAALAAMALAMQELEQDARRPADWLRSLQQKDGSVGVSEQLPRPAWTTSLAMLAWWTLQRRFGGNHYDEAIARATEWALAEKGLAAPQQAHIGHNTTLVGWSWAEDTHSWLEPTAFFVTALRVCGLPDHPRTEEGLLLIADRVLESGGCNYGNTVVLGQELLPHVQPTGIAMLALAGTPFNRQGVDASLEYLLRSLQPDTSAISLCFGLMGLEAWGRKHPDADSWLDDRFTGEAAAPASCHQSALVLMAKFGFADWLIGQLAEVAEELAVEEPNEAAAR
ncbi:MAG: hypothetical protein AAGA92_16015 [Planctomycetota bacterium]